MPLKLKLVDDCSQCRCRDMCARFELFHKVTLCEFVFEHKGWEPAQRKLDDFLR